MNDDFDYHYMFKFVIIGDSYVGKSCILSRINENKFRPQHEVTLGVDLGMKVMDINGQSIKIRVWDTAGQESFRSITRSYYRGAIGILLVYDVTSRKSFNSIKSWLNEISQYANEKIQVILIGNKSDMQKQREVSLNEGRQLSEEIHSAFIETSALNGINIEEAFEQLAVNVLKMIDNGEVDLKNKNCGVQVVKQLLPNENTNQLCSC